MMKILALQFRYLGDAALMTPALRAIKQGIPDCELHALVAGEVAPILQNIPWLTRVWAFPRTRGVARLKESWPMIRALRRERFDRSVDFGGGDRSAIISRLCGARERLAPLWPGGFLGRRHCYTQTRPPSAAAREVTRNVELLAVWGLDKPTSLEMELYADASLAGLAERALPRPAVICHLASSQPKKEWPLEHWREFHRRAKGLGWEMAFTTGIAKREIARLEEFKKMAPDARGLTPTPDLAEFLAVLKRGRLLITGDSGPLHMAAGLGVPTIGLFGPTPAAKWAPIGQKHRALQGGQCGCGGDTGVCRSAVHCMKAITPEEVLRAAEQALKNQGTSARSET